MRARRGQSAAVALALSLPMALFCLGQFGGFRVNLTPSYPLGLWRLEALVRPAAIGDVLIICPPSTRLFAMALARGYLRPGPCPGGVSPLLKKVVATSGQNVRIGTVVTIDGERLVSSDIHPADAAGRPIAAWPSGLVPPGQVFLHSDFVGSHDSRYFGPIPSSGILGRAIPVLTFGG